MSAYPSAALAAIRARVEAATPGPWDVVGVADSIVASSVGPVVVAEYGKYQGQADAAFIAHARDDVPRLVAALDAVLALCDRHASPLMGQSPARDWVRVSDLRAAITDALGGAE